MVRSGSSRPGRGRLCTMRMTSSECLVPNTLLIGVPQRRSIVVRLLHAFFQLRYRARSQARPASSAPTVPRPRMTLWRWKDNVGIYESGSAPAS